MSFYDTLIISGGSTAGINMVGKLCRFLYEKKFDLGKVKTFAGVSIGAMICYFLIIGYGPLDIFCFIINSGIKEFFANNFSPISGLIGNGIYPMKKFKKIIMDIVGEKKVDMKFSDLRNQNFLCTAYNLDDEKYVIFSNTTTPEMNILDAVILSCAIPFIFEPMLYNNNRYVDGGIINNFPLKETVSTFKCDKILGLICKKNYISNSTEKVWYISDILSLFFAHITHKIEEQLEEYKDVIEIIKVESKLPFYKLQLSHEQMFQMFLEGLVNV